MDLVSFLGGIVVGILICLADTPGPPKRPRALKFQITPGVHNW